MNLKPEHALMLDGLAQCYENEASIGPKSKAQYAAINAEACHAGSQAVRAMLVSGHQASTAERAVATVQERSAKEQPSNLSPSLDQDRQPLSVEQGRNAALDRLAQANTHRPKLWMCPDCHVRCRIENAPNHADNCQLLRLAAMQAPKAITDDASPEVVLLGVLECAHAWDGNARLLGNVRAVDIQRAIQVALEAIAKVRAESAPVDQPIEMGCEQDGSVHRYTLRDDACDCGIVESAPVNQQEIERLKKENAAFRSVFTDYESQPQCGHGWSFVELTDEGNQSKRAFCWRCRAEQAEAALATLRAQRDEAAKPETGPMQDTESLSGVQELGSSGLALAIKDITDLRDGARNIESSRKERDAEHLTWLWRGKAIAYETVLGRLSRVATLRAPLEQQKEKEQEHLGAQSATAGDAACSLVPAWLPIESAPKDGTIVLGGNKGSVFLMKCVKEWSEPWATVPGLHPRRPTRWMPLPPAPEGK